MYYLKLVEDKYVFYQVDEEKGEALDPGDIEISNIDYAIFQKRLTIDSVVQVIEPDRRTSEKGVLGYLEIFDRNDKYLRIFEDTEFGFITPELYRILPTDIPLTQEDYDAFMIQQCQGKSFRLKVEPQTDQGLFGYVEEYTPDPPDIPPSETDTLKEQLLQQQLATAEAIEKQETDKIEQQLAQAEMFETILQMLEPQGGGE